MSNNTTHNLQPAIPTNLETTDDALSIITPLTPLQSAAFEVLTTGGTISAAARAAHVTRRTLYLWLDAGHPFAHAYEQWKSSIAETTRTRLLMISEAATVQIARSIHNGDTRAALAVVKGMGLLSPPPIGPSLTQSIARKKSAEADLAEQKQLDHRAAAQSFQDLLNADNFQEEMGTAETRESK